MIGGVGGTACPWRTGLPAYTRRRTGLEACRYLQECLSLPMRLYERCSRGRRGEYNRYFLRNEANKSIRINKNSWKEVLKATKKRNAPPNKGLKKVLFELFADKSF